MTIEEMRRRKAELGYSNETLSKLSGVPFSTVQKVFAGTTKRPRQQTIEALARVLAGGAALQSTEDDRIENHYSFPPVFRERMTVYGSEEKKATIEDIYALPEGVHAQLLDGQIYFMASPTRFHQEIVGELFFAITSYIRSNKGKCKVYDSPFAVYLMGDDSAYLEPDISVICDRSKLDERGCCGAPDWIIEVLSPSTQKLDLGKKLIRYREAGVREYWIVHPEKRIIIVHQFGQDQEPAAIYGFEDEIGSFVLPGLKIRLGDLLEE